jgi:hypothetical protein
MLWVRGVNEHFYPYHISLECQVHKRVWNSKVFFLLFIFLFQSRFSIETDAQHHHSQTLTTTTSKKKNENDLFGSRKNIR